jgi:hypothetical protein
MMLANLLRSAWLALLAVLPASLLSRLDSWARRQAEVRVERRLRTLRPRG